ncbi:Protein of unknown function [Gryllus bimaculatus]|nr:Protein of unknown function [Gryllus bimaculatus]
MTIIVLQEMMFSWTTRDLPQSPAPICNFKKVCKHWKQCILLSASKEFYRVRKPSKSLQSPPRTPVGPGGARIPCVCVGRSTVAQEHSAPSRGLCASFWRRPRTCGVAPGQGACRGGRHPPPALRRQVNSRVIRRRARALHWAGGAAARVDARSAAARPSPALGPRGAPRRPDALAPS